MNEILVLWFMLVIFRFDYRLIIVDGLYRLWPNLFRNVEHRSVPMASREARMKKSSFPRP